MYRLPDRELATLCLPSKCTTYNPGLTESRCPLNKTHSFIQWTIRGAAGQNRKLTDLLRVLVRLLLFLLSLESSLRLEPLRLVGWLPLRSPRWLLLLSLSGCLSLRPPPGWLVLRNSRWMSLPLALLLLLKFVVSRLAAPLVAAAPAADVTTTASRMALASSSGTPLTLLLGGAVITSGGNFTLAAGRGCLRGCTGTVASAGELGFRNRLGPHGGVASAAVVAGELVVVGLALPRRGPQNEALGAFSGPPSALARCGVVVAAAAGAAAGVPGPPAAAREGKSIFSEERRWNS